MLTILDRLYIKDKTEQRKVWICLFTCVAVRAVHLELVEDMSAEFFLEALRRFVARRGKPDEITSDNATHFKAAKRTVDMAWKDIVSNPEVQSYLSDKRIRWNFIIELSPWMGGFYERLVGTTKMALKKSIGRLQLTQTQLHTIITEVEGVINSRPLVYVDNDIETKIITPMHFLSLNTKNGTPTLSEQDEKDDPDYKNEELTTSQKIFESWKKGNQHLEQFWKVWKDDYLLNLRERSQRYNKHPKVQSSKVPKVGDIVQIKESAPRGTWKIGRIVEMITSQDGEQRAAKILTPNKNVIQRSIIHLYPLECNDENVIKLNNEQQLNENENKDNENKNETVIDIRPKRRAATEARDRIFGQTLQED